VTFEVDVGEERFGMLTGQGRVRVGDRKVAEATLLGFAGDPGKALG
jgi:3-hydroxyacyl-[acyl-carrier-protein] dehydratase